MKKKIRNFVNNNTEFFNSIDILSARTLNRPLLQMFDTEEALSEYLSSTIKTLYHKKGNCIIPGYLEDFNNFKIGKINNKNYLRVPTGALLINEKPVFIKPNCEAFERALAAAYGFNLHEYSNNINVSYELKDGVLEYTVTVTYLNFDNYFTDTITGRDVFEVLENFDNKFNKFKLQDVYIDNNSLELLLLIPERFDNQNFNLYYNENHSNKFWLNDAHNSDDVCLCNVSSDRVITKELDTLDLNEIEFDNLHINDDNEKYHLTLDESGLDIDVKSCNINIKSNTTNLDSTLNVTGEAAICGDTAVGGAIDVASNAAIGGTLTANGATTLNDTLRVCCSTSLNDNLYVDGATCLSNTLCVACATTLRDELTVDSCTCLKNALNVAGSTAIGGSLTAGGTTCLNGALIVKCNTTLQDELYVCNRTILKDELYVCCRTCLGNTLGVGGSTGISGKLTTSGDTCLKKALCVDGVTTLNDTLNVGKSTTIGEMLTTTGATCLCNTLNVDGVTTLNDILNVDTISAKTSGKNTCLNGNATTATSATCDGDGCVITATYKKVQDVISSPTAGSDTATAFIDTINQDAQGVITATKKEITYATTNAKGIVRLSNAIDCDSTCLAATANAV